MNSQNALGFIETAGLVTAIQAADAMVKSAEVSILCYHKVDGQNICVVCEGDVASCQAAVDAGCAVASAVGCLLARNVIARPADDDITVPQLLADINAKKAARKAAKIARRMAVAPESSGSASVETSASVATENGNQPAGNNSGDHKKHKK